MEKNNFIKASIAIFIFLGIIISLFPPFEFGRSSYNLPIKKYDIIFGSIKKYIIVSYDTLQLKFYNLDSLEYYKGYYKNLWGDCDFILRQTSTDTFYTTHKFLFKKSAGSKSGLMPIGIKIEDGAKYTKDKDGYWQYAGISDQPSEQSAPVSRFGNTSDKIIEIYGDKFTRDKDGNLRLIENYDDKVEDAINYNEVRNDYEKSPRNWDFKYVKIIDSVKKYDEYTVAKPVYYLLDRKIILNELFVEYILAFFISIILGYGADKITTKFFRKV
ncbi:MAG: hypothetical protein ABR980_02285 [Ignavibacteriaceae bacterium]|jgi:hypothetical protein